MTLTPWNPIRDLVQLQDRINHVFNDAYGRGTEEGLMNSGTWIPPVDIYQNGDHELVLKAELPDMKEEAIELTVEGHTLTLRGERKLDTDVTEEQFQRIERSVSKNRPPWPPWLRVRRRR